MLRWTRGKTRLDHIRNEDTRKEAHVKPVETFLENKRLKLFGHICTKSLRLEFSGRSRGRPKIGGGARKGRHEMRKYQLTEYI